MPETTSNKATPDALDDLLDSLGYPAEQDGSESEFEYEGDYRLFDPLRRRGWLHHFDAEGSFFNRGAHSALLEELFDMAGLSDPPPIRDYFVEGEGWVMEIADPDNYRALHSPSHRDRPSDYAELDLVTQLFDMYAEQWRVLSLATGDQTACLCVLPEDVVDALLEREWLQPAGQWSPSPDVLRAEWLDDEPSDLERLDESTVKTIMPREEVIEGHRQLSSVHSQKRRQACRDEVAEALHPKNKLSRELLVEALRAHDSYVSDWGLEAFRSTFDIDVEDADDAVRVLEDMNDDEA